ncbi:putative molybdenum carrier protein [Magnetococcus sp. PR-3]|uniref:putative molybdenum carrier protein n=1 Tax=Magnetococcus sp. PR-3 TaxID=3120355 RepID=UPI002FCE22A8
MLKKIISGGQTGVDRAALDAAIHQGLSCGGWIPANRRAEDGPLSSHYPMRPLAKGGYLARNRLNVQDSDATLIFTDGPVSGGTARTVEFAQRLNRPLLVVQIQSCLQDPDLISTLCQWITAHPIQTLNIAGPRESRQPGIYQKSFNCLIKLIEKLQDPHPLDQADPDNKNYSACA